MTTNDYLVKDPHWVTKFLWWCAGADVYFLSKSPMQDRVKYAGIGGIVLVTGIMACFAGYVAFDVAFGPKAMGTEEPSKLNLIAVIFAIMWGFAIFNLDRFIVSSTGKGDGTDTITWPEFKQAIPRIIIALILGFTISKPLEIKIIQSEIDAQLSIVQNEFAQELNNKTDSLFIQKRKGLEDEKKEYESKLLQYEKELKVYSDQVDELVARQQAEMQDKRAYGFGPVARKMQADIDTKRNEKEKFIELKKADVASWRKQLDFVNGEINKQSEEKRKEQIKNDERARKQDGLLQRIGIAHEIGFWLGVALTLIFLSIEMGPIFFKMMMTKGVYDFMVENYNNRRNVESGIYREDFIYEGKNGAFHLEKYRFLEVESAKIEKQRKIEEQNKLNDEIINKWAEIKHNDIQANPTAYFTEGNDSINHNNA